MILGAILACEVAFWVFLAAGLAARYLMHRPRLGLLLLLGSPATELALLALTTVDLHRGAAATQAHALAAVYLGFSVAFGHSVVRWADRRFAQHYDGGPPVAKPQRTGRERARYEWREFAKAAVAWAVSCSLLLVLAAVVGDVGRAQALLGYVLLLTLVLVIWFVTGPMPASISAQRAPDLHADPDGRSGLPARTVHDLTPAATHVVAERGGAITEQHASEQRTTSKWAPWWVYVVVILGANYLRQAALPFGTVPEWAVVLIALVVSAALFAAVTAVHRARDQHGRT